MKSKNVDARYLDHYVFNPVGREVAEMFVSAETLRQIDAAKHQIAETAGVRVNHVRVNLEMLVIAEM
jgi:hypothetical protein